MIWKPLTPNLRALAVVPGLELETDYDRNLFMARMARQG